MLPPFYMIATAPPASLPQGSSLYSTGSTSGGQFTPAQFNEAWVLFCTFSSNNMCHVKFMAYGWEGESKVSVGFPYELCMGSNADNDEEDNACQHLPWVKLYTFRASSCYQDWIIIIVLVFECVCVCMCFWRPSAPNNICLLKCLGASICAFVAIWSALSLSQPPRKGVV